MKLSVVSCSDEEGSQPLPTRKELYEVGPDVPQDERDAVGIIAGLVYTLRMDDVEESAKCKKPAWVIVLEHARLDGGCPDHPEFEPTIVLYTPRGVLCAEEIGEEMFLRGNYKKIKFRIRTPAMDCPRCDVFWLRVIYRACDKSHSELVPFYLEGSDGCPCTPMLVPESKKKVVPAVATAAATAECDR
jgi:hypothetical protein